MFIFVKDMLNDTDIVVCVQVHVCVSLYSFFTFLSTFFFKYSQRICERCGIQT